MDNQVIGNEMPKEINCYKIGKFLYSYRNYNVFTGINKLTKEEVIIKTINKKYINGNSKLLTFINNEILYTKILMHNNILKSLETHESPLYIFIITENFKGELLSSYMNKNKKLEESKALKIFSKLISAMIYIHNMNICHLNINLDSILIDENDENLIKIFDFKYGQYYYAKFKTLSDNIGTNMFTAPEMFSIDSFYPELVDVWSCGILLCYLLTGEFSINSNKELDTDERYIIPNDIDKDLQDLLKNILCIDIEQRYRFDDILNSKYFTEKNYYNEIMEENNDNLTIDGKELKKIYERYLRAKVDIEHNKNSLINIEIIIHRELLPDDKRMSKLIEMFGKKAIENTNILPKKNIVKNNKKKQKENNNNNAINNNLITKDTNFPIKKKDTFTDFKFNKNKIISNEINKGNSNKKKGVKGKRKSVFEFYNRFPQKSYLFEIPENIPEKEEFKFSNQKKENGNKNDNGNAERKYLKKKTKIESNPKFIGKKINS
jgi:serine/threonine protein kinase